MVGSRAVEWMRRQQDTLGGKSWTVDDSGGRCFCMPRGGFRLRLGLRLRYAAGRTWTMNRTGCVRTEGRKGEGEKSRGHRRTGMGREDGHNGRPPGLIPQQRYLRFGLHRCAGRTD
nr:hypothetical protein CFP56_19397 [Quercus suber]